MIDYLVRDGIADLYTPIYTYKELNPHKVGQMPWGDKEAGLTLAITYNILDTSRLYQILGNGYVGLIDKINVNGQDVLVEPDYSMETYYTFNTPGLHTVYFKVKDVQDVNVGSNCGPIFLFAGSYIDSIYIPSDLKVIPNWFFGAINVSRLVIPNTITEIGQNAIGSMGGVIGKLIIQDGVIVNTGAFGGATIEELYCYGKYVSNTYQYFDLVNTGVANIKKAVIDCNQIYATTPSSIEEVELGKQIKGLAARAFKGKTHLKKVTLKCDIAEIPESCFYGCIALTDVNIPNTVTTLAESCFRECSVLEYITIPDGVTTIGYRAFNDCITLKSIRVPDSVVNFDTYVFCGCKALEDIYIGKGITVLGERTFNVCYLLNNVTMPENLITIGERAFQDCYSFTNIVVPDKVTSIGQTAFLSNTNLKTIVIGKSVSSIGDYVFNGCQQLESIYILNITPPTLGGYNIFYNIPNPPIIYVPAESLTAYLTAYGGHGWTILPIPEEE